MLINCHTYYSFGYGSISPNDLLDEVQEKGYKSLAITDINNTSACIDMVRLARERGLQIAVGIDFRNGIQQQYVGIAQNNEGFRELNEHLSQYLHNGKPFPDGAPGFQHAYIIYPIAKYKGQELKENEFLGASVKEIRKLSFSRWRHLESKIVILQALTFRNKRDFNAHRLLRSISLNTLLSKLPVGEQATGEEHVPTEMEMRELLRDYPMIIWNTKWLLEACEIDFYYGKNKNKRYYTGSDLGDFQLLEAECQKGLEYRYGVPIQVVLDRLEKEMGIIKQMGFGSYFLINWDLVRYAQHKGYYYVGRGSGANSMVAFLLRITDVDPIDLDLYFERFINPYRTNPPDFDIDFSWTDRDDITRYIFEKYDKGAALLGAYNTFQYNAVIRELGKVFGLPADEIDQLQKVDEYMPPDQLGQLVLKYSQLIKGFPSHLSIHSSGILISDKPITNYTATNMPPKGYPTTQFSMLEAEDIGLYKFDILSQRGLGKIKDALDIIRENRGEEVDIHNMARFKEDPKVKDLLRTGMAIGCFYVESPAMRMLLTKLQADDYVSLVAASSIIRPGVAKSGMMREYILRFRDKERREKAKKDLPHLYEILQETYGVMVYQEDVIKVAHFFAGLTLAEADVLRRGMSWKFKQRNEFWKVKDKFFSNCKQKGYDETTTKGIWIQIESFANYAFSKGHSASYAVESFQALFLKAYYPLEYLVATLNNGGGFYSMELYVHEARLHGAKIEAPCINRSLAGARIYEGTIYLGFQFIGELEGGAITEVLKERQAHGTFSDLREFMKRVSISSEQLRLLVKAGAFRFTGFDKKELLWDMHFLLNNNKRTKPEKKLFDPEVKRFELPTLWHHDLEKVFDEMKLFGFSLSSPFLLLEEAPPSQTKVYHLKDRIGEEVSIVGYLVHIKTTSTSRGEKMHFGTWLDLDGKWLDTVHFPPSAKQFPFMGRGCYNITGKVAEEFEFISVEVEKMEKLREITPEGLVKDGKKALNPQKS